MKYDDLPRVDPGVTATPHLDAARKVIEQMRAKRQAVPGPEGAQVRISAAMLEAWSLAIAGEFEVGTSDQFIYDAVTAALGEITGSLVATITIRADSPDLLEALANDALGRIADHALEVVSGFKSGDSNVGITAGCWHDPQTGRG